MIHEIGVELAAQLQSVGCPVRVIDGPENTDPSIFGRERIVIGYDEDAGKDRFSPVRGVHVNPKHRMTIGMACKIAIYAQATNAGTLTFEHRRRARHILDLVLVAMDHIASSRKNAWSPGSGGFVTPPDLKGTEKTAGSVYEFTFSFDRGVAEQTWTGDKRPEGTFGSVTNTTNVTGPEGGAPVVGCGS